MLEGLDSVDWANLGHAYGAASDVPICLRGLLSEDKTTREGALSQLYGNIWHQGTVYEATAYAVPFLIEMVGSNTVQGRSDLLAYLRYLANGHGYVDVHHTLDDPEEGSEVEIEAEIAQERQWVQAARDAVGAGVPTYLVLLREGSETERANAAYLLGTFIREEAEVADQIREGVEREVDPLVRASLLFALGETIKGNNAQVDAANRDTCLVALSDANELVSYAAAVALACLEGEHAPFTALERLLAVAHNPDAVTEQYRATPWDEGGWLMGLACYYLALTGAQAVPLAPDVIALIRTAPEPDRPLVARAAFALAFHGQGTPDHKAKIPFGLPSEPQVAPTRALSDLTPTQHELLLGVAETCQEYEDKEALNLWLRHLGLPLLGKPLRRFVGLVPHEKP